MFYVLFGIVLGSGNPANRSRNRDLHAGDHGMFWGDGSGAVRLRREPRHRARPGLAAGEARFAHAGVRLFPGQAVLPPSSSARSLCCCCWRLGITFGGVRMPLATAAKLVGILVAGSIPFSAMGLAIGYFAKPNSAPGGGQPDLLAHVVLLRAVDSAVPAAARIASVRQAAAAVSPQPVGAECGRDGESIQLRRGDTSKR